MRIGFASFVPAALALCAASSAHAEDAWPVDGSKQAATLALIGDTPYGSSQIADFESYVASINADPDVQRVVHMGDIKNGSSRCDTSYF